MILLCIIPLHDYDLNKDLFLLKKKYRTKSSIYFIYETICYLKIENTLSCLLRDEQIYINNDNFCDNLHKFIYIFLSFI